MSWASIRGAWRQEKDLGERLYHWVGVIFELENPGGNARVGVRLLTFGHYHV